MKAREKEAFEKEDVNSRKKKLVRSIDLGSFKRENFYL